MAYSRFAKNPFGFFGKYEAVVKEEEVKEGEVKEGEVKVEEKVETRMVEWHDLTPEEQERAIQYFLEIPQPLYDGKLVQEMLMTRDIVLFNSRTKEGNSTACFLIDSQRKIHMIHVLPHMLKRLGIKESYSYGILPYCNEWFYIFSPVIAPTP